LKVPRSAIDLKNVIPSKRYRVSVPPQDPFYEKADALIGVYRDQADASSKTLSLDMAIAAANGTPVHSLFF
jgi:hypothetical protein